MIVILEFIKKFVFYRLKKLHKYLKNIVIKLKLNTNDKMCI